MNNWLRLRRIFQSKNLSFRKLIFLIFLQNGESALHAAALFGHVPIVKQLIGAGADPALCNQDGLTPLQVAAQAKKSNVVDYLKSVHVKVKAGVGVMNGMNGMNGIVNVQMNSGVIRSK